MPQPQKIRLRNLDQEVLDNFRNNTELIGFDSLTEDVVIEIKNQTTESSLNKYNDRELRNRIILLESDKLDSDVASETYLTKEDGAAKTFVEYEINAATEEFNTKIQDTISDLSLNFIERKNKTIDEALLSQDLQDKINLRYENNRVEEIGTGVDVGEFNKLVIRVDRNTDSIDSLQSYINENAVLKDDAISISQLDSSLQNTINKARTEDVLITISDLDNDLQGRLSLSLEDIQDIKDIQDSFKGETGQTFFASFNEENGETTLQPNYMMATNAVLIRESALLEEAKASVLQDNEHDIDYIIDSEANKLYQFNYETSLWEESQESAIHFITGRFVKQYKTGNLYFSSAEDEYESVLNISDYVPITDMNDVVRDSDITDVVRQEAFALLTGDVNTLKETVKEIETNKTNITNLNAEILSINKKLEEIEAKLATLG